MATAVQIELMVDEKGAVQGFRNIGGSAGVLDATVKSLDATLKQLNEHLAQLGSQGAPGVRRVANEAEGMHRKFQTSFDTVRLLRTELGVQVPRAMESIIARNEVLMASISKISNLMVGWGAVMIGVSFGREIYDGVTKLWQNWLSVTKAAEDYRAEVEKQRAEDFVNVHSIETAKLRIDETTKSVENLKGASDELARSAWRDLFTGNFASAATERVMAHELAGMSVASQQQGDKLRAWTPAEQHRLTLTSIQAGFAPSGYTTPLEMARIERERANAENLENLKYTAAQEGFYGNDVSKSSGEKEFQLKEDQAQREYEQKTADIERANAIELRHLHEQALESGLKGSKLLEEQEAVAIADLRDRQLASASAIADVQMRFHNERMKQIEEERKAAEKTLSSAIGSGMTGVEKINFERNQRLADIRQNGPDDPVAKLKLYAAANAEADRQILDIQQQFAQGTQQIIDRNVEQQVQGFARIRLEANAQIAAARADFEKQYSTPELQQAHAGEWNARVSAINGTANADSIELARRNSEETVQIELEARARSLSAEKQQTAAIRAELDQRVAAYQKQLDEDEISQEDFNRRVTAAQEIANAQMVEASKAAREKMAGEFTGLFRSLDHPMQALKEAGDKVAGQAAAALVQRMQNRYGGHAGRSGPLSGDFSISGIFDKLAGAPSPHEQDNKAKLASRGESAGGFAVGAAQIHVQNATIVLGGVGGAARAGSGSPGSGIALPVGSGGTGASSWGSGGSTADYSAAGFGGVTSGISQGSAGASIPIAPIASNRAGAAISDVGQGIGLFKEGATIFGSSAHASSDSTGAGSMLSGISGAAGAANGTATSRNGGMLGGGGIAANGMGAITGALGVYSAFEGNGGVGGVASGAMSGMQLGMAVGGPIGAAIGAVGGAILGAFGFGGREKARVYDLKQVRPHIAEDYQAYQTGTMDYLSAYGDLQSLDITSERTTKQWGPSAHSYYNDTIRTEIAQARGRLDAMERAGRSNFTASAAQYALGTDSVPGTGWAFVHDRERIFPSDQNERITRALETGADMETVARNYRTAMRPPAAVQRMQSWGGGDTHIHLNALDTKTGVQWLMENKHTVRAANNASYAENSGGSDAGV